MLRNHLYCFHQGCGVGVEAGVGVGRSRPFCLESESELESVKFCRLRLRPGVAGYQPSTVNDFGRTVMRRPENIERREEMESGSGEIKFKRHLLIEFRLIRGIRGYLVVIASLCEYVHKFKDCHIEPIQKNQREPQPAAVVVSANGCCISASPVWIQSKMKSRK